MINTTKTNTDNSGWNAMGKPVPKNRLSKGYKAVKEMLECDNETAWAVAIRAQHYIEKDDCAMVIGHPTLGEAMKRALFDKGTKDPDDYIGLIDLTGRYRLLAEMLTD